MYETVLQFWFNEIEPKQWWQKNDVLDQQIRDRFLSLHQQVKRGELYAWRDSDRGRLAEIIVLDQFSRNLFRASPEAFAQDSMALVLAQEAIRNNCDTTLSAVERSFLYMPFMHSESLLIHNIAEQIYRTNGIATNYDFELKHKAIIERFGRYPHRNEILGRVSTTEELTFLSEPGSSF